MHFTIQHAREIMSNEFTKYHIQGLPFPGSFHHFTGTDKAGPHDHPFSFTTYILSGGYVERIYTVEDGVWGSHTRERKPGTAHKVEAECIHEIIELPKGECWTLIIPGPHVRTTRYWRFNENGISFREWYEKDFTPL